MGYIWFRAGKMGFFLVFFPWEFLERTAGVEGRKLRKSQNFFGIRTPILEFFWEFLGMRARSVPAFPSSGSGMEEIENPQVFMGIKPQSWNILGIFFGIRASPGLAPGLSLLVQEHQAQEMHQELQQHRQHRVQVENIGQRPLLGKSFQRLEKKKKGIKIKI